MSKLSVFLNPVHGRPTDIDFIRKLQPASVKIVNPDVQKVADVHAAAPNALIVLRNHPRSEEHDQAYANPIGTGASHADSDAQMWAEMQQQAQQHGLHLPSNVAFCGLNEPHVWTNLDQAVQYYVVYLDQLKSHSLKGIALSLSVGWPGNHGPDTPPDWQPLQPICDAIKRGNHMLGLHEYWSHDGPKANWRWWAGRYTQCPWDVPILIGECGVDDAVANGNTDYLKRGWRANLTDQQYVAQLAAYDAELIKDDRIHSAEVFCTDGGREWITSMDTEPAHSAWLDYASRTPAAPMANIGDTIETTTAVNLRNAPNRNAQVARVVAMSERFTVTGGPSQADGLTWWQVNGGWMAEASPDGTKLLQKAQALSGFDRSIRFVLRWEGGYANNPADPGGETNFGISKRSYPDVDIKNLTQQQAIEIYRRDYWPIASTYEWPLCLAVFDLAVNGGAGRAQQAISEVGTDFLALMAWRVQWYTTLDGWTTFGRAWIARCADLLNEARA